MRSGQKSLEGNNMKKLLIIIVTIMILLDISLDTHYVIGQSNIGYEITLHTGDKLVLVGNDGNQYTLKILDLEITTEKALILMGSSNKENTYSIQKNESISYGAITITLKRIYIDTNGELSAVFILYGVTLVGNHATIIIKSNPSMCEVYINNKMVGYSPLRYFLTPGDYSITVICNSKKDTKSITISALDINKTRTIYFEFESYAFLSVNSTPSGASVYLNGTFIGFTPIVNYKVLPGRYKLGLLKDGFLPYSKTLNVTGNNSISLNITLTSEKGHMSIFSNPPSASVYIDNKFIGVTPLRISLSPGIHELLISKKGYIPSKEEIEIKSGDDLVIKRTLIPQNSTITITSNIPNATVYIDNEMVGNTPLTNFTLRSGNHTIKISKEGYFPFYKNVTILPGTNVKVTATLNAIPGIISVMSNIENASIYLNGTLIGKTPLNMYKVKAGKYTITVMAAGYSNFSKTISVAPNSSIKIEATLTPLNLSKDNNKLSLLITKYKPEMLIASILLILLTFIGIYLHTNKKKDIQINAPTFPISLRNKYEPLEFLGEGGFAKVFKVKKKKDKKIIALKVFPANEKAKKFFTKEVRAWKLLDHPNIVKLYNAFESPMPHLELEFVEGYRINENLIRDLEQYPKPIDEKLALRFIEGIANGLKHAHSKQVYHRDLKPSNILLKSDLTPKITDFGLAKVGSKSTTTTTKALTPLYAAPEQIDEKTYGHTDHRTDIYQLGVVLYELLTGKLPYEGSSHLVILAKITNPEVTPKPPSKHNLKLAKYDKLFEKLLAKRKEERYQSVDEFLKDFKELVSLLNEKEKLKETLKVTQKTITSTKDEAELKKLNLELLRLLIQNTILSAKINDKEEVINTLYDMMPFTKKHRAELDEAIRQVQVFVENGTVIPKEFIEALRVLLHKIEKEIQS